MAGSGANAVPEPAFLAHARSPQVREMYVYWCGKCAGGRLPGRQDISPDEMAAFLPYVILFDVERHGGRYRFRQRLIGTHIVDLFGRDLTGVYVDQSSSPEHYAPAYARLSAVVETQQPVFGTYYPPTPHRDFIEYEHLTLPLASDGEIVDMLLGVRCGIGRQDRG